MDDDAECLSPDSFLVKVPKFPLTHGKELTPLQNAVLSIVNENIVELHLQMNKAKKYKNESFNVLAKILLKAFEASLDEAECDEDEEEDESSDFSEKPAKKQKPNQETQQAAGEIPVTDLLGPEHFHADLNRSKTPDKKYKKCAPVKLGDGDKFLCVFAEIE